MLKLKAFFEKLKDSSLTIIALVVYALLVFVLVKWCPKWLFIALLVSFIGILVGMVHAFSEKKDNNKPIVDLGRRIQVIGSATALISTIISIYVLFIVQDVMRLSEYRDIYIGGEVLCTTNDSPCTKERVKEDILLLISYTNQDDETHSFYIPVTRGVFQTNANLPISAKNISFSILDETYKGYAVLHKPISIEDKNYLSAQLVLAENKSDCQQSISKDIQSLDKAL